VFGITAVLARLKVAFARLMSPSRPGAWPSTPTSVPVPKSLWLVSVRRTSGVG
jgi:hypothetical protein